MKPATTTTTKTGPRKNSQRPSVRAAEPSATAQPGGTTTMANLAENAAGRRPALWAKCSTCGDSVLVPPERTDSDHGPSVVLRDESDPHKATLHCLACGEAAMRLRVDGDYGRSVNLAVFRHAVAIAQLPAGSGVRARLAQLEEEERACRQAHAERRVEGRYQLFNGEVLDFVEDRQVLAAPTAAAFKIAAYYDVLMSNLMQSYSEDGFRLPF